MGRTSAQKRASVERLLAAWPGVEVDPDSLAELLESRRSEQPPQKPLHEADLALALACGLGDRRAHELLETRFLDPIARRLSRRHGEAAADEAIAVVRRALLMGTGSSSLAGYKGTGPLMAWIRVAASRAVIGARRESPVSGSLEDEALVGVDDPVDAALIRRRYGPALKRALTEAIAGLDRRERVLLKLSALDGLSVDKIGAIFHVHRASAARWVARARERILEAALTHLRADLGLNSEELHSLVNAVRSEVTLSLPRLLGRERQDGERWG